MMFFPKRINNGLDDKEHETKNENHVDCFYNKLSHIRIVTHGLEKES